MNLLFTFLIIGLVLISITLGIVILSDNPALRNTPLPKARIRLLALSSNVSDTIKALDKNHLHGYLLKYVGWSVPIFYFIICGICLNEFFKYVFGELPESIRLSMFHRVCITTVLVSILVFTILSMFTNPGIISTSNVIKVNNHFKNNNLIFFDENYCSTCDFVKPARSKHCSVCNNCVMLFDHHCIWINNCLGYYNYKWFMGYLIANVIFLSYGSYLCIEALLEAKKKWPGISYWGLITKTTHECKTAGTLLILASIFSVITILFTMLHLRYIYLGVTTNECDKWSEIQFLIESNLLYQELDKEGNFFEKASIQDRKTRQSRTVFLTLRDSKIDSSINAENLTKINSIEDIENIYDHGFMHNLFERIFNYNLG